MKKVLLVIAAVMMFASPAFSATFDATGSWNTVLPLQTDYIGYPVAGLQQLNGPMDGILTIVQTGDAFTFSFDVNKNDNTGTVDPAIPPGWTGSGTISGADYVSTSASPLFPPSGNQASYANLQFKLIDANTMGTNIGGQDGIYPGQMLFVNGGLVFDDGKPGDNYFWVIGQGGASYGAADPNHPGYFHYMDFEFNGTKAVVPVPAAFWLLLSGIAGIVGLRRIKS